MDKSQAKKYTKIAVTLGVIAGGSALLIGLANVITAGPIAKHELEKKLESIRVVYGDNVDYGDEIMIGSEYKATYPSLISYYNAKNPDGSEIGNVFVCEGKNQFGPIKMAIGIDLDNTFGKVSLIVNGQTLPNEVNAYVDEVNKETRPLSDVKCGATFGATLINDMGNEAMAYYKKVISNESSTDAPSYVKQIFGANAVYGPENVIANEKYPELKAYYTANGQGGSLLGHVFITEGANDFGPIKMSIGLDTSGKITKIFLIENGQTNGKDKVVQGEYVDKVNSGDRNFDDINCGATFGAKLINDMGKQAQAYLKAEINKDLSDVSAYCKEIFGKEANYIRKHYVMGAENLTEEWTATDKSGKVLGRVYHGEIQGMHVLLGVNIPEAPGEDHQPKPHTFGKAYWVNPSKGAEADAAQAFITKLNAGEANLEANASDNDLIKNIKNVANQALAHAAKNRIEQPMDVTSLKEETFGSDVKYVEHVLVDDIKNPNMIEYWNVKNVKGEYLGRTYHMQAAGEHGTLEVLAGITNDARTGGKLHHIATNAEVPLIKNEHTDSTAAVEGLKKYIAGLNNGTISIFSKDDVKNGATGTSNGIQALCLNAISHYSRNMLVNEYLVNTFGNEVRYIEHQTLSLESVKEYWNVMDNANNYVGRVYHTMIADKDGNGTNALFAFNKNGAIANIYVINGSLNAENISLMTGETQTHYKANPVVDLFKDTTKLAPLFEGKDVTFANRRVVSEPQFNNIVEYWNVNDNSGKLVAYAYHVALAGRHAVMEMTVSVDANGKFQINLLNKADGKYGDIAQAYVDGLNDGSIKLEDDIQNGATSTSNGIRTMVLQCLDHAKANKFEENFEVTDKILKNNFGAKNTYTNKTLISDAANDNLIASWDVNDESEAFIGRVYLAVLPGEHDVINALIFVKADGSFGKMVWADAPDLTVMEPQYSKYPRAALAYIEKLNNGEVSLLDDVANGATGTTTGFISLANQAINHYSLTKGE